MLEMPQHLPQTNATLGDKLVVEVSFLTEIQVNFNAATWIPPNIAKPDSSLANHPCGWRAEGCHCRQSHCRAVKLLSSPFPSPLAQTAGLPARCPPRPPAHTSCPGNARLLWAHSWVHGGVSSLGRWRPVLSPSHLPPAPSPSCKLLLTETVYFPLWSLFSLVQSLPNHW